MNSTQKKQTIELIASIKGQIENIIDYEQSAPLIEVDIIKENIRKLYELVNEMTSQQGAFYKNNDNVNIEAIDTEIEDLINQASQQFEEEAKILLKEQEDVLSEQIEDENIEAEISDENIVIENEIKTPLDKKPLNDIKAKETEVVNKKKKIVHILEVEQDEFEEDEKVKSEEKSLMGEHIKKKRIKSLKSGIGINDKFMIMNDLFEGIAKDYNSAIKELDNQESQQAAIFLLEDMKDENLWESNDRAYIQFKNYIERRYM